MSSLESDQCVEVPTTMVGYWLQRLIQSQHIDSIDYRDYRDRLLLDIRIRRGWEQDGDSVICDSNNVLHESDLGFCSLEWKFILKRLVY